MIFYVAVHLINAHLAQHGNHFRRHEEVDDAINPHRRNNPQAVSEDAYKAYAKLRKLSRKSRYLLAETDTDNATAHVCDVLDRDSAVDYIGVIADYLENEYNVNFESYPVGFRPKNSKIFHNG